MPDPTTSGLTRVFVYGTLKRGHCNHHLLLAGTMASALARARFVHSASTKPHYAMYDCGGYPGLVPDCTQGESIHGEIWEVDSTMLCRLHSLEGVNEGLYVFKAVELKKPTEPELVYAYFYAKSISGFRRISEAWPMELDYGKRKTCK